MLPSYENGQFLEYAVSKGWKYKISGNQIVLELCPICGGGGSKFYGSIETGLWDDKRASCGRKGNFWQLQRELGDVNIEQTRALALQNKATATTKRGESRPLSNMLTYELALADDPVAQAYLANRNISMETARAWHFGVKTDEQGVKWLLIPYLNKEGDQIVDVKYRSLPPAEKAFKRLGGGDSILYGEHLLADVPRSEREKLYLVEGELDAVTLWQHGYRPVLSTTIGASGFKERWYDLILSYDPQQIVVIYDSDVAGQKGALHLLKKFDDKNIVNVELADCKDVNEYFTTHTPADFDVLLAGARSPEAENIRSMRSVLDDLEEQLFMGTSAFDGIPSQFEELNAMVAGGYWNGQLTCISASSGTGKTSFVLQELFRMAHDGHPAYLLCLEMPATMMMRKLIEHRFGIPLLKQTLADVQSCRKTLDHIPLFFGDKAGDLDDIEKTLRTAVKRYDAKIIAFDNLHYFVRSIEHTTQEIARVTKRLKELAIDLHIPIVMIAQPRKFDEGTRVISGADLKDSVAIKQDSDNVILLYRKPLATDLKDYGKPAAFIGNMSPYTLVRVDKARYSSGGDSYLYFAGERSTFSELTLQQKELMGRKEVVTTANYGT